MPSKKVSAPARSPLEDALLSEQVSAVREQQQLQRLLAPILLEQAGFTPTLDSSGNIVGVEKKALSPEEAERQKLRGAVETGLLKRSEAALAGKLPVSPTLEREIEQSQKQLRENLRRQLGSGFETSTPGANALATGSQRAIELREAARRGELTLSEQLGVARLGANQAASTGSLARLLGTAGQVQSGGLSTIGAFNAPISALEGDLSRQFQATGANVAQSNARTGQLIGAAADLAGTGTGLGLGKLFGVF